MQRLIHFPCRFYFQIVCIIPNLCEILILPLQTDKYTTIYFHTYSVFVRLYGGSLTRKELSKERRTRKRMGASWSSRV